DPGAGQLGAVAFVLEIRHHEHRQTPWQVADALVQRTTIGFGIDGPSGVPGIPEGEEMRTLVWEFVPAVLLGQINVPYERLRDANKEPGNWLTYSRDYSGQRYSPLDQINTGNVGKLRMAWMRQVNEMDTFETSPIVVDSTLFVTAPPNVVEALDAATGRTLWSTRKALPTDLRMCSGKVNRGLAILRSTLYYASTNAHLIALDARPGGVRWDVTMAHYKIGYSSTGAPLAVKDKIVTGM